jgi:hypothetical protein
METTRKTETIEAHIDRLKSSGNLTIEEINELIDISYCKLNPTLIEQFRKFNLQCKNRSIEESEIMLNEF